MANQREMKRRLDPEAAAKAEKAAKSAAFTANLNNFLGKFKKPLIPAKKEESPERNEIDDSAVPMDRTIAKDSPSKTLNQTQAKIEEVKKQREMLE